MTLSGSSTTREDRQPAGFSPRSTRASMIAAAEAAEKAWETARLLEYLHG